MSTTGKFIHFWQGHFWWEQAIKKDQSCFPRPWSKQDWEALNPEHFLLTGFGSEEELEAFALFQRVPGDDTSHLLKIWIESRLRGSPLSRNFWAHILDEMRGRGVEKIFLEVESSNLRAFAFYQKHGFQVLRTVKGYYSDGQDGVMMLLTL
jgi:[ribosomal protein S18]-alanine N-acetyltransferase